MPALRRVVALLPLFALSGHSSTLIFGEHDAVLVTPLPFDGGTRDGLETVGPICVAG
jgi:hypothetical protein